MSLTTARQAAGDRQNAVVLMHSPGAVRWVWGGGPSNRERAASLGWLAVSALTVTSSLSSKQAIVKSITKL